MEMNMRDLLRSSHAYIFILDSVFVVFLNANELHRQESPSPSTSRNPHGNVAIAVHQYETEAHTVVLHHIPMPILILTEHSLSHYSRENRKPLSYLWTFISRTSYVGSLY